ncbi:MAG TPA: hypothetical protein PLT87_07600 [Spirochaetales bacterium]|nr:hypothetical protein [Spirochaetales bacterium]
MMTTKEYFDSAHRFGRIAVVIVAVMMIALPFALGLYFHAMPSFVTIIQGAVGLLAVFIPVTISEVLAYTPVLGSSIYLTLITGNVLNLKLPVAVNAMKIADVEQGSEKGDVISAISVAVSSIVTVTILAVGALLMLPLKSVLLLPAVKTATSYIIPALFGAFTVSLLDPGIGGGIKAKGRLKGAILPAVLMIIAFFALRQYVTQLQGVFILILLPVTFFGTKYLYKKGQIEVILPNEKPAKK